MKIVFEFDDWDEAYSFCQYITSGTATGTATEEAFQAKPEEESPTEEVEKPATEEEEEPSLMMQLSTAAAEAAKEHGVDFLNEVLDKVGAKKVKALEKRVASINDDRHDEFYALLEAGPEGEESKDDFFEKPDKKDELDGDAVRMQVIEWVEEDESRKEPIRKYIVEDLEIPGTAEIPQASQEDLAKIVAFMGAN